MTTAAVPSQRLTTQQRNFILTREINSYLSKGYMVASQTEYSAQLRRPKKFSFLWATLWLLLFGVGILVYLVYYAAKRDELIYIEITETGHKKVNHKGSVAATTILIIFLTMLCVVLCVMVIFTLEPPPTTLLFLPYV